MDMPVGYCRILHFFVLCESENCVKMLNSKIGVLAIILAVAVVLFFVITEAFHLLTAPSDLSVLGGVVLLFISFLVIVRLAVFAAKKLF